MPIPVLVVDPRDRRKLFAKIGVKDRLKAALWARDHSIFPKPEEEVAIEELRKEPRPRFSFLNSSISQFLNSFVLCYSKRSVVAVSSLEFCQNIQMEV